MPSQSLLGLTILLLIVNLGLGIYIWRLASGVRTFRQAFGQAGKDIDWEEVLRVLAGKVHTLEQKREADVSAIEHISAQLSGAVQKVGLHRFNALADDGGNLSFTLAFLNEKNSGIVVTSMNGRSNTRIYTKVVDRGQSVAPLTAEEITAISEAQNIFSKNKNRTQEPH